MLGQHTAGLRMLLEWLKLTAAVPEMLYFSPFTSPTNVATPTGYGTVTSQYVFG